MDRTTKGSETGCIQVQAGSDKRATNLMFVTGCDRLSDGKWYRLLQLDGKLVLKGQSTSTQLGHTATSTEGSDVFALAISEVAKPLNASSPFDSSDLKQLRVGVYRVDNGKKITAATVTNPLPTVQTFALSPDSRHLAILENDQIVLYPLPQTSRAEGLRPAAR